MARARILFFVTATIPSNSAFATFSVTKDTKHPPRTILHSGDTEETWPQPLELIIFSTSVGRKCVIEWL